jgi:uncharacterized protein (DUF983 family)
LNKERYQIGKTLARCLRLRCPACGGASIVERPFHVRHHCPACSVLFQREAGFFVGAIVVNIITTEVLIVIVYLICLLTIISRYELILTILFILGILFPVAFYHHSWSFWLGFDHLIETLPKYVEPDAGQSRRSN